jgi:hypothetical protein
METPLFLSGWKDIANYLGKGVRTVQRYERELGLPVRRPAGKPRGSVVVTRAEIDAWVAASPIREAFYLTRPAGSWSDPSATIRKGMLQMTRLREQMTELREELRRSIALLHASVEHLHESTANQFRNESSPSPLLGFNFEERRALEMVYPPAERRRAS